jgi:hypothetical protein
MSSGLGFFYKKVGCGVFLGFNKIFFQKKIESNFFFSQDSHSFFQLFVYLFIYLEHEKYACRVKPKVGGISKNKGPRMTQAVVKFGPTFRQCPHTLSV